MDEILKSAVEQVPSLAVLVILVVLFLKENRLSSMDRKEMAESHRLTTEALVADLKAARDDYRTDLKEIHSNFKEELKAERASRERRDQVFTQAIQTIKQQ